MKKQLLITIILIIFGFTTYAQPGTIDLTFNPIDVGSGNGANNDVLTTSIQSDGKIIIGGNFTSYNGNVINRIARLNTDGTLDTTFNPGTGANGYVYTTSIQSDGKIIIGGDFTTYNGIPKLGIARLNINGTLDTTFNAAFYNGVNINSIRTTSVQSDGKIIIGGCFNFQLSIGCKTIVRLNTNGTLDATFNTGTGSNYIVQTTSIQNDGKIIIGGDFTTYNGISRNRIARLNSDGTLDTTFNPGTGANVVVNTISIQSDGKIIIGGEFTSYNGIARDKIARVNTDGTLDTTFNPATGQFSVVYSTSIQSNGKIIIGYTNYNDTTKGIARLNTIGTLDATFTPPQINLVYTTSIQSDGKIIIGCFLSGSARLNIDGTLDTTFDRVLGGADDTVYTTSIQSDGKIIIGGGFSSYNGIPRNNIVCLNANGTLDTSFIPGTGADNAVYTTSTQSDGKIIIGGLFTFYNGIARNYIARLNTNGTLDTTFNPGTGATGANINSVYSTSIQSDGKIIIGGDFTSFNGVARSRIARLNTDGTLDTTFNPGTGFNNRVYTTSIQSDGKIIIGGQFNSYNGIARNNIVRLNTNGTLDATFNPGTGTGTNSDLVLTTSIQSDGKIIIGGRFASFNGISRNGIARLNTDGTLDATFDPGTGTGTNALRYPSTTSIQSDGKIIIGGIFTSYNGIVRNNIARLNTNGTLDATFNPGTGANNSVSTTSIQSDGKIIIGGSFTGYNDIGRNRITRINGNNTLTNSSFDKSSIAIYPNPSNGIYTLQTNEMNDATAIFIYTILGQKIYDIVISSNATTIDISNQPKGVYLYKVFGEEGETKSGKLVIE